MSTLTFAVGEPLEQARGADPADAVEGSQSVCATPLMIAFSSTGSSSSTIHVPSASENVDRTCRRTSWLRANSTERSWSTLAPLAESSSISS